MKHYLPPKAATDIPVIDLAPGFSPDQAARRRVAWDIHKACRETGFFYISNHRVTPGLVADQFAWSRRFFDLPLDQKLAIHMRNSPTRAGYEPIGGQVLDSQDKNSGPGAPDLKESFYVGVELPDDDPTAKMLMRGYGHNLWPAGLPGFREQMLAYQKELQSLADHVLRLLALSIDVEEAFFQPYFDTPVKTVRLIKYPAQPGEVTGNQIGAGAHTDWGAITILAQDSIGGLEVRTVEGEWIEAPPIPDTFVVNLGDLLARWTNDIYTSNFHRVKNNSRNESRYSVPFFYNPRRSAQIDAIPTCVSDDHPRKYPCVTAAEHLDEMFRRSYGAAAL
jgi:isopenicillin N synthase-like dioxygenase